MRSGGLFTKWATREAQYNKWETSFFFFFFFYRACLLLFPVDTGKTKLENSRWYECVYKCSCGLVSERRPGVQTLGKTQDSTLSSTIAKLFLPGFLTVLKPRAFEEVQGKDEKFILCFCFSQRPADLERWMVTSDKDQEVYPLMPGLWESYLSFPVLSSQGYPVFTGTGFSALRIGSQAHSRRDIILHHPGRKEEGKRRRRRCHPWLLINYQSWQWQECEKQSRKVKKRQLYSLLHRK